MGTKLICHDCGTDYDLTSYEGEWNRYNEEETVLCNDCKNFREEEAEQKKLEARENIVDIPELFVRLREGKKVHHVEWEDDMFLTYNGEAVRDENGDEMNISVLMNNWGENEFYTLKEQ